LLNNAISNYGFKQDEKDYILTNALNQEFIYKFMEVHIYLQYEGMLALKEQRKPTIANFTAYFRKSMKNSGFWL
jgi:phage anti-repressor protein